MFRRLFPLALVLALIAAACGAGDEEGSSGISVSVPPSLNEAGGSGEQTPIEDPETGGATTTTAPPATAGPQPTELPDSDYPAIVVTDLAGGTVDLRELALGDKPTLLWFWAPH